MLLSPYGFRRKGELGMTGCGVNRLIPLPAACSEQNHNSPTNDCSYGRTPLAYNSVKMLAVPQYKAGKSRRFNFKERKNAEMGI